MTSPTYLFEGSKKNKSVLMLSKRIFLIILACCIQMLYLPTSDRITGGMEPKLPIDIFPIWSIWVLPYVLCYVLWFSGIVWIILRTEDRFFRAFLSACILTFAVGNMIFILFPTYVTPVALQENDIFTSLLRILHGNWGRYDAFPSSHIYITTLLALFFSRLYPPQKWLWVLILVIVSLSTLFTGQHYVLDLIGGYAVAFAGYHFGLWWTGFIPAQRRPHKTMSSSSLN